MHKRNKKSAVVTASVIKKSMLDLDKNEAHPPKLAQEILDREDVAQFISPETRGPQEPALPPNLFDPLPLTDVADQASVAVIVILFLVVFIAGVTVGKLF
ncbi:MAG: hypothetical protein ABTQ25_18630 [Nitrosomonas ureae]